MSKAADRLREIEVYNDYGVLHIAEQMGAAPVAVIYHAATRGRGGESAKVQVHHLREDTDPNPQAFWRDYRRKTFNLFRYDGPAPEQRRAAVADAQAWAGEKYGIEEWATVPGLVGSWYPAEVAAKVRAMLREHAKASK